MDKTKLKKFTYSVFSDRNMIILAILAMPVIIAEYFFKDGSPALLALLVVDGLIYLAFVLEFALKVYVEKDKARYIKDNKKDSAISIIIILSPLAGLLTAYYALVPLLRLIRVTRLFRTTRITKVADPPNPKYVPRRDAFSVTRVELRKALVGLGMEEKSILMLFNILNKAHRHINAIGFVTTLERMGLDREKNIRVLRRIGMDDVVIANVFRMVDESKINAEIGKVYNAIVDFS